MIPFQVLGDCPHCGVEAGVVEVYDPSTACCHLGVPAETRCKLCGVETRGTVGCDGVTPEVHHDLLDERCPCCGVELGHDGRATRRCSRCGATATLRQTVPPRSLATLAEVREALSIWAGDEGYASAEEMLEASFEHETVTEVRDAIAAHLPVPTSFDVLGFLFAHMASAASALPSEGELPLQGELPMAASEVLGTMAPTRRIKLPTSRPPHRRNRALPLISVMAVDGRILDCERQFIAAMLSQEGLAPLDDKEIRVHRPHEVGPVGSLVERERLIELMVQLAHIDSQKDESEMRLIREYGRAWGVDPARVEGWEAKYAIAQGSKLRRFMIKFKSLFLS